jgi:hypothetical protein
MKMFVRNVVFGSDLRRVRCSIFSILFLFLALSANTVCGQGTLTNGWLHTGNIGAAGVSNSWTFTANVGDAIVVRVGEVFNNSFTPRVQIFSPASVLLTTAANSVAAEASVTATNSGTFTVVISDNSLTQTNSYRLTLAKSPGAVSVAPGDDGGPMTNGVMHSGTILAGDLDVWTFNANSGDSIVVRIGLITATNTFNPWVRLYGPDGKLLDSGAGSVAGEVAVTATNSGMFTVVAGDGNGVLSGSGDYRLTLAKTGDAVVVSAGDEGGPMTNAVLHTGTLLPGDLDVWTFNANSGDSIVARIGTITVTNVFNPWIRIYGPNGKLLDSGVGSVAGEVAVTATNSGTFIIVAGDGNGVISGSGDYRLTLVKTGDPVVISAGDDGGPMTNAVMHTGTLQPGDLDAWTFDASSGDGIVLRIGGITSTNSFTPWIRLYGPNGKLVGSGLGTLAGEVAVTATNSGTFIVVASDGNGVISGSGNYRLTLVKTGDPVVISSGDDGGPMTNDVMHLGTIQTGDLDAWTFTANSGDAIVARIGLITSTNTFNPWIRLYGPNGKLLDSGFGALAGEVAVTATNSGTFIIVAADGNGAISGSGNYRLTLVKTGDPVVVSAGDDGGPMTNDVMHLGTIQTGDLDAWTFTANSGDAIVARIGLITSTNTFNPWIRLYGPNGKLLDSGFGALAGEVAVTATNSGTFIIVAADSNGAISGSGAYRLTLAKTGDPVVISLGDNGGPLTNGLMHTGTILTGDLDLWTVNANAGESLIIRIGELNSTNTFTPWLRLYGPNGKLLDSHAGAVAGEVTTRATNSGTFLVVAGDGNGVLSGSGDYRLTLAKSGTEIVTVGGDEGGSLNGVSNPTGTISLGDVDLWSFTTCRGEVMQLRVDELTDTSGNFTPWLRLYSPDGALLGSVAGATFAQLTLVSTNSGTFIAVISDGNGALSGTGTYSLTNNGLSDELRLCSPIVVGTNANLTAIGGLPGSNYIVFTATNITTPQASWTPIRTNQFDGFGVFSFTNLFDFSEHERYFRLLEP